MERTEQRRSHQLVSSGAGYALYAVVLVLAVAVLLLWRTTMLALRAALLGESDLTPLLYGAVMALLGFGLFVLTMAAEPYLRSGIRRRQLRRRFARLAVPLAIAWALGFVLQIVAVALVQCRSRQRAAGSRAPPTDRSGTVY